MTYGRWSTPAEVLADTGRRLADAADAPRLLESLTDEMVHGLGFRHAEIRDHAGRALAVAGAPPRRPPSGSPLTAYGSPVGELRWAGPPLRAADRALLEALAHQIGGAVHTAGLVDELRGAGSGSCWRGSRSGGASAPTSTTASALRWPGWRSSSTPSRTCWPPATARRRPAPGCGPVSARPCRGAPDRRGAASAGDRRPRPLRRRGRARARARRRLRNDLDLDLPEQRPPLPAAVEVAAYRVAQEALTNVVRHAGASRCRITGALPTDALVLEVADDGCGGAEPAPGSASTSMRDRARQIGGTWRSPPATGNVGHRPGCRSRGGRRRDPRPRRRRPPALPRRAWSRCSTPSRTSRSSGRPATATPRSAARSSCARTSC